MTIMKGIIIIGLLTFVNSVYAQNVGINSTGAAPDPSAILDVDVAPAYDKGFLKPRLTTAQRLAIVSPADGLEVYDVNLGGTYRFSTINNKWDCATTPAGTFDFFCNVTAPIGYLVCDGSAVSRTTYPELYNAIGNLYGAGNGTTTFNLPDFRGEFVRGVDDGRGVDPGRVLGSNQSGSLIKIDDGGPGSVSVSNLQRISTGTAASTYSGDEPVMTDYPNRVLDDGSSSISTIAYSYNNNPSFSLVTRPRNIALLPCIKY